MRRKAQSEHDEDVVTVRPFGWCADIWIAMMRRPMRMLGRDVRLEKVRFLTNSLARSDF
jgi:hypothetical protein